MSYSLFYLLNLWTHYLMRFPSTFAIFCILFCHSAIDQCQRLLRFYQAKSSRRRSSASDRSLPRAGAGPVPPLEPAETTGILREVHSMDPVFWWFEIWKGHWYGNQFEGCFRKWMKIIGTTELFRKLWRLMFDDDCVVALEWCHHNKLLTP